MISSIFYIFLVYRRLTVCGNSVKLKFGKIKDLRKFSAIISVSLHKLSLRSVLFSYGPSFHTSSAQAIYWGDRKIKDRYKTVWKECTCILFSLHGFDAICCSGNNRNLGYLWKSKLVLRSNLICCYALLSFAVSISSFVRAFEKICFEISPLYLGCS